MNPAQLQKMMKQAQKMQNDMGAAQGELEAKEYTNTTGGAVTIKMLGSKEILSIDINKDIIDPDDKDMLEDMIKSCINTLHTDINKETESVMGQYTKGLPF